MTDELPICMKCRVAFPCVLVETIYGERTLCIANCFPLWLYMMNDMQRRTADLLREHQADFFDEPTQPNIPTIRPQKPE